METKDIKSQIDGVGAKYEELSCFSKSRYQFVYQRAFEITELVLKQNQKLRMAPGKGNENRRYREFYNIIPFLGERGSGKTSAMLSFMEGLKDYYRECEKGNTELPYYFGADSGRKYNALFTCLDCIDGSLLEKGEDAFKMILAQMYRKFLELDRHGLIKNTDYDHGKTRLFQSFEEVFRTICEIESINSKGEQSGWTDSSMLTLKTMSNSLDLKIKFENLVKDYLELIQYEDYSYYSKGAPHILVITIDDLDLNIEKGFEMLEKIHRYMMIPNVLVLISADYKQLKNLCEKHFYKEVPKVDWILKVRYTDIDVLTEDYLSKVLPLNYRIYMSGLSGTRLERIGRGSFDTKKEIFHLFYQKIGVTFDSCGEKRHFYEEDILRQFINLLTLLEDMPELGALSARSSDKEKRNYLENLDRNSQIILSDIRNRMVNQKIRSLDERRKELQIFKQDERKWLRGILDLDPARSMREMVAFVNRNSASERLKEILEYYGYSYGEVLRSIYCWGREDENNKGLLHCFMAYYTVMMTNLYLHYRYTNEVDERKKAFNTLKNILNGSLAGSWANKLIPKVMLETTENINHIKKEIGIRKDKSLRHFVIRTKFSAIDEYKFEEQVQEAEKLIKTLVVLCMLFKRKNEDLQWQFKAEIREPDGRNNFNELLSGEFGKENMRKYNVVIRFANVETATFNIMNFIPNALEYDGAGFESMLKSIKEDVLVPILGERYKALGLEKSKVWKAFSDWEKNNGRFALPFYDLDLTYNVIKRVRRLTRKWKESVYAEEVLQYYQKVLNNIEEQLEKCDEYYGKTKKGYSFRKTFAECPYVRWIKNYEKELVPDFPYIFQELIYTIMELQDLALNNDDDIGYDAGDMA